MARAYISDEVVSRWRYVSTRWRYIGNAQYFNDEESAGGHRLMRWFVIKAGIKPCLTRHKNFF